MELEINKTYMIKHTEQIPTRIHQSDFIVEVSYRNRDGNYEYIGKEGLKFHFFNQEEGYDLYLSKEELENKIKL